MNSSLGCYVEVSNNFFTTVYFFSGTNAVFEDHEFHFHWCLYFGSFVKDTCIWAENVHIRKVNEKSLCFLEYFQTLILLLTIDILPVSLFRDKSVRVVINIKLFKNRDIERDMKRHIWSYSIFKMCSVSQKHVLCFSDR